MTEREEKALLERQAAWQRSRAALPWAEKLRMSVVMREALIAMRGSRKTPALPGDSKGSTEQARDA